MKSIIIGNVREEFYDSPIRMFQMAIRLSKQNDFTVRSNNPQFIEALEVLCGEENIVICFQTFHNLSKLIEIDFRMAYNYLGEVYDIINKLRMDMDFDDEIDWDGLESRIRTYQNRWEKFE